MRDSIRWSALLLAAVSSACSLAPPDTRPALPTSATYPQDYVVDPAAGASAIALQWRDFFPDPRLETLVAAALERNRDLVISVAQIEEARGLYGVQRADRLPTIAASAQGDRSHSGSQSAAIGGATLARGTEQTLDRYAVGLGMSSFELDFWGRVRNLSNAARAQYLATLEATRAFRLTLIRDVAIAYLNSLEASERVGLAEATVESRREGLRIAKRRLDAGITSALDYSQTETLLTQAETELAALKLFRAQSDNLLVTLIGGPIDTSLPPPVPLAEQARTTVLAAGLPSDLLANRPDILAAEQRLKAARANIGAARAAFFPSITLTGSYGYASADLDQLVGNDALTWSFGPVISLPIFDFGRRHNTLTVAQARENIAIADYERTIQTGFREVADALAGRRYLAEQVAAQERALAAQRRLAELARTRYREGVARYLEVLDAERSLFSTEQALLQARRDQVANLVTLYVALGGGQR